MLIHSGELQAFRIGPRLLRISTDAMAAHEAKFAKGPDTPEDERDKAGREAQSLARWKLGFEIRTTAAVRRAERKKILASLVVCNAVLEAAVQADPKPFADMLAAAQELGRLAIPEDVKRLAGLLCASCEYEMGPKADPDGWLVTPTSDARRLIKAVRQLINYRKF